MANVANVAAEPDYTSMHEAVLGVCVSRERKRRKKN